MKPPKKPRPDAPVARADNPYMLATPAGEEDDFMASLLGGLDESSSVQPSTSFANPVKPNIYAIGRKRKIQEQLSALEAERASKGFRTNSTPVASTSTAQSDSSSYADLSYGGASAKRLDTDMGGEEDTNFHFDDSPVNGDDTTMTESKEDDDEVFVKPSLPSTSKPKTAPIKRQLVNTSVARPTPPKVEPVEIKAPVTPSPILPPRIGGNPAKPKGMDWRTATASLATAPVALVDEVDPDAIDSTEADAFKAPFAPKNVKRAPTPIPITKHANALETDGSLRFWWYDMLDMAGIVYLVGKVQQKDGRKGWVSAMVMVGGIQRRLFLLPREKMLDGQLLRTR